MPTRSRYYLLISLLLALTPVLSACSSDNDATPTLPAPAAATATPAITPSAASTTAIPVTPTQIPRLTISPAEQASWLNEVPCKIPCFLGITPQITTRDETVIILQDNKEISNVEVKPPQGNEEWGLITWFWPYSYLTSFAVYENVNPYRISSLSTGVKATPLNEVIRVFGEPSQVLARARYDYHLDKYTYQISFIYRDKGFLIGTTETEEKPNINPGLALYSLAILGSESGLEKIKDLDTYPNSIQVGLVNWSGFQNFDFYCRNGKGGSC